MIPVCFCGNRKIFNGLAMSVLSLAANCSESLHVYVLSMNLCEVNPDFVCFTERQIEILNRVLKEYNPESRAELLDVTQLYKKYLLNGKNQNSGYTPYTLLRLLLDEMPDMPDKLVYLDVDTVCTGDVKQLYDTDISAYEFAAALDYMGKFWISRDYCNAGVMLINLANVKKTRLFAACREEVVNRKMIMPDQTALNRLANAKLILPRRFNEQRERCEDTVVKHFCKGIRYLPFFHIYNVKQWQRDKVRKVLKIKWMEELYSECDRLLSSLGAQS